MSRIPKTKISAPKSKKAYAANRVKSRIQALVKGTHGPETSTFLC
jgi:hypothetical protein